MPSRADRGRRRRPSGRRQQRDDRRLHPGVRRRPAPGRGTDSGEPCSTRASTTSSGTAAAAPLRSPAAHVSCISPQLVAAAEPVVERGVGRHGQVGRDQRPADGARVVGVLGRADEDARDRVGRPVPIAVEALRDVGGGEPVEDRAVGLAPGQPQHLRPQRGEHHRRRRRRRLLELEPLDRERCRTSRRPARRPAPARRCAGRRGPACTARRTRCRSSCRRSPGWTCRAPARSAPARRPPASPPTSRSAPVRG